MSIKGSGAIKTEAAVEKREGRSLGVLRLVALIVSVAGALGSLSLTLWFGRRNPSYILPALFAIWVLSPFVAMVLACTVSKRWSIITRASLYCVTLVLTLVSLSIYFYFVFWPPESTPAAVFLLVPLASWLFMMIVVPIAALVSGKLSRQAKPSD